MQSKTITRLTVSAFVILGYVLLVALTLWCLHMLAAPVTILIIFSAACTCGYAAHVFLDLMACINDTESKGDGA